MAWCDNCRREVTDVVGLCPVCGCDVAPTTAEEEMDDPLAQLANSMHLSPARVHHYRTARPHRVQTIEQTAKVWKAQMLISILILFAGMPFIVVGLRNNRYTVAMFGAVVSSIGLTWHVFARMGAWWNHG